MALGFADLHSHQFANLGFGGVAFHGQSFVEGLAKVGAAVQLPVALPRCDVSPATSDVPALTIHGAGGTGDIVGSFLPGGSPGGHKVAGFSEFDGWPRWNSVTHQAMYEDCLYRAVQGGLRLMVMLAVNNEKLTRIVARKPLGVADRDAIDRQIHAAWTFMDHIDERAGGPGRGWYRLVFTPQEAKDVINAGKLAVVLGVEVDYPFDGYLGGDYREARLREEVDRYFAMGIRHVFPLHFSDNAFGGTAFQNDLQVALFHLSELSKFPGTINPLNPITVGAADMVLHSYRVETEEAVEYKYRTGRRNIRGLTDLGKSLVGLLITRGMMMDIDHMSRRSKADTFDICESYDYPVVSGHTGLIGILRNDKVHEGQLLDSEVERLRNLNGILAVVTNQGTLEEVDTYLEPDGTPVVPHICGRTSNTLAQAYLYACHVMQGAPVAIGTDLNGFIGQIGPRYEDECCPGGFPEKVLELTEREQPQLTPSDPAQQLRYPFRAVATEEQTELDRSVVGNKTFDFNVDGLAHVGMLPDLIADLQAQGVSVEKLNPLIHSAEGYIDAWQRAWDNHLHETSLPDIRRPGRPGSLNNRADSVTVGILPRGAPQVWVTTDTGALLTTWPLPIDIEKLGGPGWADWVDFGSEVGGIVSRPLRSAVGVLSDGRLEHWVLTDNSDLLTTWKVNTADGARWAPWSDFREEVGFISGSMVDVAVGRTASGELGVWILRGNGELALTWKTSPDANASWSSWEDFSDLAGVYPSSSPDYVAVGQLSDGRLELWAGTSRGWLYSTWQKSGGPDAEWVPWRDFLEEVTGLPSAPTRVAAAPLSNGAVHLWAVTEDGRLWTTWKTSSNANASWVPWRDFLAEVGTLPAKKVRDIAAALPADGRLTLWAASGSGIFETHKTTRIPNATWTPWTEIRVQPR